MTNDHNTCADQSNLPCDCVNSSLPKDLDAMSAAELAEEMECVWSSMTEETYDDAVICAYLDALDRKAPMPEMPDAETAHANFRRLLRGALPETSLQDRLASFKHPVRLRRLRRTALVAVAAILCLLAGMITAQAAGIDVFGAMARWTEEVFSFGTIRDDGTKDDLPDNVDSLEENTQSTNPAGDLEYNSVQDALDAFEITEVAVPTWFPDIYDLIGISITNIDDMNIFTLSAIYEGNDGQYLSVVISRYTGEPSAQIEKNDTLVETFDVNGITFFLVENNVNYTLAWVTEHYECYITEPNSDVLRDMANSIFEQN